MMSEKEKDDTILTIARQLKTIKTWWPIVTAVALASIFLIKVTNSARATYDNEVAKKTDIVALSKQISELANDFNQYRTIADSRSSAKDRKLDSVITIVSVLQKRIKKLGTAYVSEVRNANGAITFKSVR